MSRFTFLILHYHDTDTTLACVRSIQALTRAPGDEVRILVIDNDTDRTETERDETRRRLTQPSPAEHAAFPVVVLPIVDESGFSAANNKGYRFAREHYGAQTMIVCNNDILFDQEDFLGQIAAVREDTPFEVLAPDIVRASTGEHQNPMDARLRTSSEALRTALMNEAALAAGGAGTQVARMNYALRQRAVRRRRTGEAPAAMAGIVPLGACLIFTETFVRAEETLFTPETVFFYEEYLLALRCRRRGYRIVYDPRLKVLHESGKSIDSAGPGGAEAMRFRMRNIAAAARIYREELRFGGS